MGTEELNALRCGTCYKLRMGIIGEMVCKMTGHPASKDDPACISHSRLKEMTDAKTDTITTEQTGTD